ncbi:MAG: hypothetical protein QOE72_194 [Chloroflexota bacterium]|nr:hypothetical protein [Chloroflexota bacterium]
MTRAITTARGRRALSSGRAIHPSREPSRRRTGGSPFPLWTAVATGLIGIGCGTTPARTTAQDYRTMVVSSDSQSPPPPVEFRMVPDVRRGILYYAVTNQGSTPVAPVFTYRQNPSAPAVAVTPSNGEACSATLAAISCPLSTLAPGGSEWIAVHLPAQPSQATSSGSSQDGSPAPALPTDAVLDVKTATGGQSRAEISKGLDPRPPDSGKPVSVDPAVGPGGPAGAVGVEAPPSRPETSSAPPRLPAASGSPSAQGPPDGAVITIRNGPAATGVTVRLHPVYRDETGTERRLGLAAIRCVRATTGTVDLEAPEAPVASRPDHCPSSPQVHPASQSELVWNVPSLGPNASATLTIEVGPDTPASATLVGEYVASSANGQRSVSALYAPMTLRSVTREESGSPSSTTQTASGPTPAPSARASVTGSASPAPPPMSATPRPPSATPTPS